MEQDTGAETPNRTYEYKPIKGKRCIRVIVLVPGDFDEDIRFRLDHVLLDDSPRYEALSYAWGDASVTSDIYDENGGRLGIGQSLYSALRYLRQNSSERTIWADAVSINQQDDAEKSTQVQLMGEIYARSQQAVIWLGQNAEDLSTSFGVVENLHQYFLQNEPEYPYPEFAFESGDNRRSSPVYKQIHSQREVWQRPLLKLITQPWFSRRWIIQEVAKAPEATVVSGFHVLPWKTLGNVYLRFYKFSMLDQLIDSSHDWYEVYRTINNLAILELLRRDSQKNQQAPILKILFSTRTFYCTDRRDFIYSLIGIAGDTAEYGDYLVPDYSLPGEEVYKRFVTGCIIQKGNLHPLSVLYIPPATGAPNIPSWVVDFSDLLLQNPLIHTRVGIGSGLPFHASGTMTTRAGVSDDGNLLYAWGIEVDVISARCLSYEEMPSVENNALTKAEITARDFNNWLTTRYNVYGGNQDKFEAFWRTLILNLTSNWDTPPPEYGVWFQKFLDYRLRPDYELKEETDPELLDVEAALINMTLTWCFCETEKGRFGQVLPSVKAGDKVCILFGGEVPYVIRPLEDGKYMFVGSCYVHGLMNGEACEMEGLEEKEFCFR